MVCSVKNKSGSAGNGAEFAYYKLVFVTWIVIKDMLGFKI